MTPIAKPQAHGTSGTDADDGKPLVVHVVRQFYPNRGGLEDVVMNLCRALPARGCRVRVVTLDRLFTDPGTRLPAREVVNGIEIVRIAWRGSSRYPLAPAVFRHVRDADLIHVHAIDFFFDALSLGLFLHRRPMVVTTHGGFFHTRRFAALKKVWFKTMTRLSALGYESIIGCSRSDSALFASIAADRVVTIENGADTQKFAGRASGTAVRRIVTIGRFSVNKRIDRLLDALVELNRDHAGWHLDIIGVPGDISAADLQVAIATRGLQGDVDVHCNLDNPAVADLIGRASVFASASEYEGFGLVAIEAMSAGLVPVLNGNDAYRLLAERHGDIRLADFSDAAAAAAAIADAHAGAEREGDALRQRLVADAGAYSWDGVADRYGTVYKAAMGGAAVLPSTSEIEGLRH